MTSEPRKRKKTSSLRALAFCGVLCLCGFSWFAKPLFLGWQDTSPSAEIYQHVFGNPVPAGVTNLKTVSRGVGIKRWAWLCFSANDAALKQITQNERLIESPELINLKISANYSPLHRHDEADKRFVNWKEPSSITNKRVYETTGNEGSWLWGGYMVIDNDTNQVYVHAGDL